MSRADVVVRPAVRNGLFYVARQVDASESPTGERLAGLLLRAYAFSLYGGGAHAAWLLGVALGCLEQARES